MQRSYYHFTALCSFTHLNYCIRYYSLLHLQGTDAWWQLSTEELLPPTHKEQSAEWDKGTDTMDVWFDSGSSWAGVANGRKNLEYPAGMFVQFLELVNNLHDRTNVCCAAKH
jgi:isoleucyl-tRNA synthetase